MAFNMLRYFEGATPGMKRKVKDTSDTELKLKKKQKWKKYEVARPDRKFNIDWCIGRDWLKFDEEKQVMTCSICIGFYKNDEALQSGNATNKFRGQNTFLSGSANLRSSAVIDHETSASHHKALASLRATTSTAAEVAKSKSGKALLSLKSAERHKIAHLFRNVHFIAKYNRPLSDYPKQLILDKAKGVDVGTTYVEEKAALRFLFYIADDEIAKTVNIVEQAPFHSFLMDGSTDIAGDEQESIYIRCSSKGVVTERFLSLGTPASTSSRDLYNLVDDIYHANNISKEKLIGMGSDGAANMVGHKSGLAALLRQEIGGEFFNVHCLCHRLELAVRDVFKTSKLYDKLMTLMIGLHYFYCKNSYKNKNGLLKAMSALDIKGLLPPKVTGTRWLAHIHKGIGSLLRTYTAYEAHLSTLSHTNPKAEGFAKLLLDKNVMAFTLFLQDILEPLRKLSLKIQTNNITLFDSITWVEATADIIGEMQTGENATLNDLLETGMMKGIALKGKTPQMVYAKDLIKKTCDAIRSRFNLSDGDRDIVLSTKVLSLKNWPISDEEKIQGYGDKEIKLILEKFQGTLLKANENFDSDEAVQEWRTLKKILVKKHGRSLKSMSKNCMMTISRTSCWLSIY